MTAPLPAKPKIFCWIQYIQGDNYGVYAMAQDGHVLASHISSSVSWAKHDIGLTSDWKRKFYDAHYPHGWELEWIEHDELLDHQGLKLAYAYNQMIAEEADKAAAADDEARRAAKAAKG